LSAVGLVVEKFRKSNEFGHVRTVGTLDIKYEERPTPTR